MKRIVLPLPQAMLDAIDEVRQSPFDSITRTAWIRQAIARSLELRCPFPGCNFLSENPEARCPMHGRQVQRAAS